MTRDDVVLQRPEDVRFQVQVFHTTSACCGAATAYLLRRIAYQAGAYAPGIQEFMFHELNTSREGGTIEKVHRWFLSRQPELHRLGYRLICRRVALPTPSLIDWVKAGKGYRGAMLPTEFKRIHPQKNAAGPDETGQGVAHAVGLTMDRLDPKRDEELVMIDPWPGVPGVVEKPMDRTTVHPDLELAHRAREYHALMYFWVGWG